MWTSLAHWSDWVFVLARTDRDAQPKHRGISYFLMPLRQDGVEIRPIRQVTGTSEFNEVFFDGALAPRHRPGRWRQQRLEGGHGHPRLRAGRLDPRPADAFRNELDDVVAVARANGRIDDPVVRQRLADAHAGLEIMRWNTLRVLSGPDGAAPPPATMITKLYWANWHRSLGELAMDVLGAEATLADQDVAPGDGYELTAQQRLFLFTRSDTIYAGSNQIQRNIIGERALGLPPEPKSPLTDRPRNLRCPHLPPTTSPATACSPARPWW